jgi:hypothetical protein
LETFPEMGEFYRECEQLHVGSIPMTNL